MRNCVGKTRSNCDFFIISEQQIMFAKENATRENVIIQFIVSDIEKMNIGKSIIRTSRKN